MIKMKSNNKAASILFDLLSTFNMQGKNNMKTTSPNTPKEKIHTQHFGPQTQADKPVTIYCHGLGGNKKEAQYFHIQYGYQNAFIQGACESFDFKDVSNPNSSCLGQDVDIAYLHEVCKKYQHVQLFGISRGASTILNYAGLYQPSNIETMVLESPFDDVQTIIQRLTGAKSSDTSMYPNYDPQGIQPIKMVDKMPKNIPILIICSKQDTLIPVSSSANVYKKLRQTGHDKAHLLVVDHGVHANILNGKDGATVRNVIHAFFRAYNQPHNLQWANLGQDRFATCQP